MSWIPALAIGGAVLALGPILIHILFRRRYRTVDFAAMRFLLESMRRNRQRMRLEELILILLRVLACLLVGLMLANIRSAAPFAGTAATTAHVFILDDSLSMGQRIGNTTLFRKALSLVAARLGALPDSDLVAVLSGSRPRDGVPLAKLAPVMDLRRDDFVSRLAALRTTDLNLDLAAALREAHKLTSAATEPLPVRLYVASDFRRQDLAGAERAESLRRACAEFDEETSELILLDFGMPCRANLAVERVAPARKVVVAGTAVPLRITVRNTGSLDAEPTRLDLRAGDSQLPALEVPALAPGEAAEIDFRYIFREPGFAAVEARLPPDALPGDNSGALALEVRESIRALIVDGSSNPAGRQSASFCLARALDPSGEGAFAQTADVRQAELWKPSSLNLYDLVLLANVRGFPAQPDEQGRTFYPHLEALQTYVREGGGVGVFLGPDVSPDFYNGPFYADGLGLCPVRLEPGPWPDPDPARFARLDPGSIAPGPMLRIFAGRGRRFAQMVRFFVHAPVRDVAAVSSESVGPVNVLARFDDEAGTPAVLRREFGLGTVVFWTTAADTRWSNWPRDLSFLPVINDMAWELVRPARDRLTGMAGQRIDFALSGPLRSATAAVLKTPAYPELDLLTLDLHHDGQNRVAAYPDARFAGVYELNLSLPDRTERRVYFARRVDPVESDLVRATEGQIRAAVDRPFRLVPDLAVSEAAAAEEAPRKAYWWIFMAILVGVLMIESLLARRFGHYQPRIKNALESAA